MTPLTLEDIAKLRELEAKATPSPWETRTTEVYKSGDDWECIAGVHRLRSEDEDPTARATPARFRDPKFHEECANAVLISASRNHLTALLDIAEQSLRMNVPVTLRWDAERKRCSDLSVCDCEFRPHFKANFCPSCGRRLEWI